MTRTTTMSDPAANRQKLGLQPDQFKALRAFLDGKTLDRKSVV